MKTVVLSSKEQKRIDKLYNAKKKRETRETAEKYATQKQQEIDELDAKEIFKNTSTEKLEFTVKILHSDNISDFMLVLLLMYQLKHWKQQ